MRKWCYLIATDLSFVVSGLLFVAGLISVSSTTTASPNTAIAPFCGNPPAGSVDCPNLPTCVNGTCTIAIKSCYCQE